jgi:integrase/recombinase XerD
VYFLYLNDVLKEFQFDLEIRKLSKKTSKSYRNNLEPFIYYFEKEFNVTELEKVTSDISINEKLLSISY